ncbi:hypothetical protein ABE607_16115 [Comamonas aquatica]|uniref:hypothetical protein n=1 Tax=Comamonas aquatica TaxID=225991 RepID=UPI003209B782
MNKKTKTPGGHPNSWHPEFVEAQEKIARIILGQGPEAIFLPEHAELVRTAAKYAPPEHAQRLGNMLRTVEFIEASGAVKGAIDAYGKEALTRPEYAILFEKMMQNADPAFEEAFRQEAQASGLLLPDAGRPLSLLH